MKQFLVAAAAVLLFAVPASIAPIAAPTAQAQTYYDRILELHNLTGENLNAIYIRTVGESSWGQNRLGSIMYAGEARSMVVEARVSCNLEVWVQSTTGRTYTGTTNSCLLNNQNTHHADINR